MLTPDVGQGYLVLNKTEHPDVKTWVIEVNSRTFDQNNQPTDKTLDKVVLKNDINYWSVPEKVSDSKEIRFVDVTGLDVNDNPLVIEGPILVSGHPVTALEPGGETMTKGCDWVCNGSYYAWRIQQYVAESQPSIGPSRMVVETALNYDPNTEISSPIYRYISIDNYNLNCVENYSANNGMYVPGVPCYDPSGIWMTEPITVPSGSTDYTDSDGNPFPGLSVVRGVGKPLNPWTGGNQISTGELQIGTSACSNIDRNIAMEMVNNHGPHPFDGTGNNYYPQLQCNQLVSGGEFPDPGSPSDFEWKSRSLRKLFVLPDVIMPREDNGWGPFVNDVVSVIMGDDGNSGLSWQEQIDGCYINNLNDPNQASVEIDPNNTDELINGFTLVPGLYSFGFAVKGRGYVPVIFEVEEKLSVSASMSDFLSVSIFPVPITEDKFNIDMTASEELKFTYEFRDGAGKLLYEEKFSLKKGQQWKHTVAPKDGIPSGNHINRFVFTDGSVLALQTIR